MKIIIIGVFLLILFSLGTAMYTMIKDKSQSDRTMKALAVRIGLSIALLLFLLLANKLGLIHPNEVQFYEPEEKQQSK